MASHPSALNFLVCLSAQLGSRVLRSPVSISLPAVLPLVRAAR